MRCQSRAQTPRRCETRASRARAPHACRLPQCRGAACAATGTAGACATYQSLAASVTHSERAHGRRIAPSFAQPASAQAQTRRHVLPDERCAARSYRACVPHRGVGSPCERCAHSVDRGPVRVSRTWLARHARAAHHAPPLVRRCDTGGHTCRDSHPEADQVDTSGLLLRVGQRDRVEDARGRGDEQEWIRQSLAHSRWPPRRTQTRERQASDMPQPRGREGGRRAALQERPGTRPGVATRLATPEQDTYGEREARVGPLSHLLARRRDTDASTHRATGTMPVVEECGAKGARSWAHPFGGGAYRAWHPERGCAGP